MFAGGGAGITSGYQPDLPNVEPGAGTYLSGYAAIAADGWEWRLGGGRASLGAGTGNGGGGTDEYGVSGATMWNVDADVGPQTGSTLGSVRAFIGARYLQWQQAQDFRPDSTPGCCGMTSTFSGLGPQAGISAEAAWGERLGQPAAGANVAALFGRIGFERGVSGAEVPPASGSANRTVINAQAFVGVDLALTPNVSLGARYSIMILEGSSFADQGFDNPDGPQGRGENIMQGPSANLSVHF